MHKTRCHVINARGCTVEHTCEVTFATCHIDGGVTSDGGFKTSVLLHMLSTHALHSENFFSSLGSPLLLSPVSQFRHILIPRLTISISSARPNSSTRPSQSKGAPNFRKVRPKILLVAKRDLTMSLLTETWNRVLLQILCFHYTMISLFSWTWRLVSWGLLSAPPLPQKSN